MSNAIVPLEVQENILDCLLGNSQALATCARVCQAWLPRVRFLLPKVLHIDWDDPDRTICLLKALGQAYTDVQELTISKAGGMVEDDLVTLLERLKNLQSLSIYTRDGPSRMDITAPRSSVHRVMVDIAKDTDLGERLLFAIANMRHLRHLAFGPDCLGLALPWVTSDSEWRRTCTPHGLRELRSLSGDMFPLLRTNRLWHTLAARKAEPGAAPLVNFGATLHSFVPPLRALGDVLSRAGQHLQNVWLAVRWHFMRYDEIPHALLDNGVSLSACRSLRTLELRLDEYGLTPDVVKIWAVLLSTAPRDGSLVHLSVTAAVDITGWQEYLELPNIPEAFSHLDSSISGLPQLRRMDWVLPQPSADQTSKIAARIAELLPMLKTNPNIEVNWGRDV